MPAGSMDKSKMPEKHGSFSKEDVKEDGAQETSPAPEAIKEEPTVEDQVTEDLIKDLDATKNVPYDRFKQVNDQKNSLQEQMDNLKSQQDVVTARAIEDAELRAAARFEARAAETETEYQDPNDRVMAQMQKQIAELQGSLKESRTQSSEDRITAKMAALEKKYPQADSTAVLGWKKAVPNSDIEKLMEKSNNDNIERASDLVRSMLEKKKERAKNSIPAGNERRILISDEERPKTIREAGKLLKRMVSQ